MAAAAGAADAPYRQRRGGRIDTVAGGGAGATAAAAATEAACHPKGVSNGAWCIKGGRRGGGGEGEERDMSWVAATASATPPYRR